MTGLVVPDDFVGRIRELGALHAWGDAALRGRGRLVLLAGPAGIGKTRLCLRWAETRGEPSPVWARAVADEGAPPLWLWRRVGRSVPPLAAAIGGAPLPAGGPGLAEDAAAQRFRLRSAAADALADAAHRGGGLVLVLDDLHWADAASVDLLAHLVPDLGRLPLLVVAVARHDVAGPFADAVADLVRDPATERLELGPLPEPDVAAYLAAAALPAGPALTPVIAARSGGHPLLLRTLVRVLRDAPLADDIDEAELAERLSTSDEVGTLVATLLRPLSAGQLDVLRAAAVLGEDVDGDVLASVAGAGVAGALAAGAAAGLLDAGAAATGRCRFLHGLLRDGVEAGMTPAERLRHHRAAAAALAPLAREHPQLAGEVARHWLHAGRDEAARIQAVHWSRRAAAVATAGLADADAARHLAAALAVLGGSAARAGDRAEVLVDLATAEYRAGRFASSAAHVAQAAEAAEAASRADLLARAAVVVHGIDDPRLAPGLLALSGRALAALAALPATDGEAAPLRARVLAQRAVLLLGTGRMEEADAAAMEAMAVAESSGDPPALLEAIRARVALLQAPQHVSERLRLGARAVAVAPAVGSPLAALWGHLWRLDALYQQASMPAARAEITAVEALVEQTRLPLVRWHLLRIRASAHALRGDFAAARASSAEATRLAATMRDRSAEGLAGAFSMSLALLRGDRAEVPPGFAEQLRHGPALPVVQASLALVLLLEGRRDEAAAVYEPVRDVRTQVDADVRWYTALPVLAYVAQELGDTEVMDKLHGVLSAASEHIVAGADATVACTGSLARILGDLAAGLGRLDAAVDHYETAIRLDGRMEARPFVVLDRLGLAEVRCRRAQRGDLDAAEGLVRAVLAEARRLDMPGPLERAAQLSTAIAVRRRETDPLSPREREIADLVAQALSNREIADRLVLSERTVETHVRHVLAKLGFTTRTQIATWIARG